MWTAAIYNMIFLGAVGLVFLVGARFIAGLFTTDPLVQPYAIACLRIVSLGFVFYACGMVLTQAFNGAGDTWTPTVINLFVFWLWEIPLAWWLSSRPSLGAQRRLHGPHHRVFHARRRQRRHLQAGHVEADARVDSMRLNSMGVNSKSLNSMGLNRRNERNGREFS